MNSNRQLGWLLIQRERWEMAEEKWRSVLSEDPNDGEAHGALALCLLGREQFAAAQSEADAATALDPDNDQAHSIRARVLLNRNRFPEATTAIAEAIRINPEDANHRGISAAIHAAQEQWEPCLAAADSGLTFDPEHNTCSNFRAIALTHLDRRDEAAATIAGALERTPEDSLTHTNQGWTLLHQGESEKSLHHFQEALRLDPSNDWARNGLLTALKAKNRLYRVLLAYFLFMNRQKGSVRWAIILGIFFGQKLLNIVAKDHPEWGLVVYPLIIMIAIFVLSTWLANPLMNLVMRFDRYGRHALIPDQRNQAHLIGSVFAASAGLLALEFLWGYSHLASLLVLLLSIPLTTIHNSSTGWPRQMSTVIGVSFTAMASFLVYAIFHDSNPAGFSDYEFNTQISRAFSSILPIYTMGILVWSIISMGLVQSATPEKR